MYSVLVITFYLILYIFQRLIFRKIFSKIDCPVFHESLIYLDRSCVTLHFLLLFNQLEIEPKCAVTSVNCQHMSYHMNPQEGGHVPCIDHRNRFSITIQSTNIFLFDDKMQTDVQFGNRRTRAVLLFQRNRNSFSLVQVL